MRKLRSSEIITLMEIRNSSCQSYSGCGSSDFWDSTGNHPALLKKNHHCPFIYSHAGTICSYTLYCRATLQRYFSFLWPGSPLEGGGPPKRQCTSHRIWPYWLAFRLQISSQVSAHNLRNSLIPSGNAHLLFSHSAGFDNNFSFCNFIPCTEFRNM